MAKESPLRNKENENPPAPSPVDETSEVKAKQEHERRKDSSSKAKSGKSTSNTDDSSGEDNTKANFGGPTDDKLTYRPGTVTTAAGLARGEGSVNQSAGREEFKYADSDKTRVENLDQANMNTNICQVACNNTTHENNDNQNVDSRIEVPTNLKGVRESKERAAWEAAILEEMNAMERHRVYDLVNLLPGRRAIGCRFVFTVKTDKDGNVPRYKARLVLLGYQQRPGIDYKQLFSPVARFETRSVLAIATKEQLHLHQLDVKSAFLAAEIEEELFMR